MPSKYLNDARTGELIQKIYTADRAIATECKSYTDTNYLPLTGGTITGNLTVSGTITGDVTGNVTGNADSATNDANGNPIASTYLPLAGGTLTGNIKMSNSLANIATDSSDKYLRLLNADYSGGASLYLYGATNTSGYGKFTLNAFDGTNRKELVGMPNGTLTWGGTSISLNGHTHSYLPLSGGTMTGEIIRNTYVVKNSVDNSFTKYLGGKDETSSYFVLYGKNYSSTPGRINLRANNDTKNSYLTLDPNGSMTWGGVSITDGTFLTTRQATLSVTSSTQNGAAVNAPAVSGYQFVCWVMSQSSGNVYATYIQNATSSTGRVWWIYNSTPSGTSIVCTALYVRKW